MSFSPAFPWAEERGGSCKNRSTRPVKRNLINILLIYRAKYSISGSVSSTIFWPDIDNVFLITAVEEVPVILMGDLIPARFLEELFLRKVCICDAGAAGEKSDREDKE